MSFTVHLPSSNIVVRIWSSSMTSILHQFWRCSLEYSPTLPPSPSIELSILLPFSTVLQLSWTYIATIRCSLLNISHGQLIFVCFFGTIVSFTPWWTFNCPLNWVIIFDGAHVSVLDGSFLGHLSVIWMIVRVLIRATWWFSLSPLLVGGFSTRLCLTISVVAPIVGMLVVSAVSLSVTLISAFSELSFTIVSIILASSVFVSYYPFTLSFC